MKDDMKVKVPNGTPKTLIPSNGVGNWYGLLKPSGKPKGNHATHLKSWMERLITQVRFRNVHRLMIQLKGDI